MTTATFTPDVVACRIAATSKKQLLLQLSIMAAAHAGLCDHKVLSVIISREKLGSTGIGNSLELLHAILDSATRPVTQLATLETPVDFGSPDNMPVQVMPLSSARMRTTMDTSPRSTPCREYFTIDIHSFATS